MEIKCKKCNSEAKVKNGFMKDKQRYKCKECGHNYTEGDGRTAYNNIIKQYVIRMYLNNCGIRRIAHIMEIPLTTTFSWIENAGKIVDEIVKSKRDEEENSDIEILEMDELFTFIKKNREKTKKQENLAAHTPEYGLLSIGIDLKILRLK